MDQVNESSANRFRFRAWNPKTGMMVHDTGVPHTGYMGDVNLKTYVYLQSTGLTDKGGKEIFEGDIVKQKKGDDPEIGVIRFDPSLGAFTICPNPDDLSGFVLWAYQESMTRTKVLGNIYENPDLLPAA